MKMRHDEIGVMHMHVEEQRLEIEACIAHYGATPMALLNDRVAIDGRFTSVHCTHTTVDDLATYLGRGGRVCVCPLTEANLGDGIPGLAHPEGSVSLGSDSNARISMLEEARWLEYAQRLRTESRGVLADAAGGVAPVLLDAMTASGADALAVL